MKMECGFKEKPYTTDYKYLAGTPGHTRPAGPGSYRFESREQTRQDSIIAGNSIFKSLILEYATIATSAAPNIYAPGSIPQVIFPTLACMTAAHDEGMNTKR